MNNDERKAYHAISIAARGEYGKLKVLFERHGSWTSAFKATREAASLDIEREWKKLEKLNIRIILRTEKEFPPLLREMPWPPFGIYVKGSGFEDGEIRIAMVGTRRATPTGKKFAGALATALARRGITIVSGLAFGIDTACHAATVAIRARTIAVLGNGLDRTYPREHEKLATQIIEAGGALVSEYPPESPSLPRRFLERNRIVSGLSKGIVVIEAPRKSGALATARFAIEQNREVFVVPGPAQHPNYEGSHELLKSGATLITDAEDIIAALGLKTKSKDEPKGSGLDEPFATIFNTLHAAGAPLRPQAIAERCGLPVAEVNRALGVLAVERLIKDESGKFTLA